MESLHRRGALAAALLLLLGANPQRPCCVITAIDARTGTVTAAEKGTGRTFQFVAKAPLKIGQGVDANFSTTEVLIDGKVCCRITSIAPQAVMGPCTLPVSLVVNPSYTTIGNPPVTVHAGVTTNVPPNATIYTFVATIPMNGHSYHPDPGTPNAQNWIWTPQEAGDYNITAKVVVLVPAAPSTAPASIPCGTATISFHVRPQTNSSVTISANPPSQSVAGNISLHATVSAPPLTTNKFSFSYAPQWGSGQTGQATITTTNTYAGWTLQPQPSPNLYVMKAAVQTFASNSLIAEGLAIYSTPNDGYIVLYPPGPCPTATRSSDPTVPFGWLNPITTQNTTQPVSTRVGAANCAIAGYALNDIVNNPQVRVRAINVSCVNCHSSWGWQQKSAFCSGPAFGHVQTDSILNNLLQDWKNRGCPD